MTTASKSDKPRTDFMALVTPKATVKRRGVLKADLFRLQKVIGADFKVGVTDKGDFIIYADNSAVWRKLVRVLLPFTDFREQRIDLTRTKIERLEVVDKDEPIFA